MQAIEPTFPDLQPPPTSLPAKVLPAATNGLGHVPSDAIPSNYGSLSEILTKSATYRDIQLAFREVTGLALSFRSVESIQLPQAGQGKVSAFCALMAENRAACISCLGSQAKLMHAAMATPKTLTCLYGFRETAVPIRLGERTVGFLQPGQVLRARPTELKFQHLLRRLKGLRIKIDRAKLRSAYFKTPVAGVKKMKALTSLLSIFAEHLSMKSNEIALQLDQAESPIIARAREFIQQNYRQKLSLEIVSRSVHMDRFYLCRQFNRLTGLTFTAYLSRLRVEKAKNLLLNPNLRISEVAFEVGFQSLSNFNLVFKRIVGESATAYRGRISIAPSPCRSACSDLSDRKRRYASEMKWFPEQPVGAHSERALSQMPSN